MNWAAFFAMLFGLPAGIVLCAALVAVAHSLDEKLGGCWGGVICFGALVLLMATLFGLAA